MSAQSRQPRSKIQYDMQYAHYQLTCDLHGHLQLTQKMKVQLIKISLFSPHYLSSIPSVSIKLMISSSPCSVFKLLKTKGLLPRILRESSCMTSSDAPT